MVWKLDRLGRNTLHILETVRALTDRGITLISTTDGIDSSTAAGRMVIGVLASMAEFERELIEHRPQESDVPCQRHEVRATQKGGGPRTTSPRPRG